MPGLGPAVACGSQAQKTTGGRLVSGRMPKCGAQHQVAGSYSAVSCLLAWADHSDALNDFWRACCAEGASCVKSHTVSRWPLVVLGSAGTAGYA